MEVVRALDAACKKDTQSCIWTIKLDKFYQKQDVVE